MTWGRPVQQPEKSIWLFYDFKEVLLSLIAAPRVTNVMNDLMARRAGRFFFSTVNQGHQYTTSLIINDLIINI